jgi:hypothetical protein
MMERGKKFARVTGRHGLAGLALALALTLALGCEPDARTVEGALGKAATALARRDARALFRVIDQRARHALAAVVQARREAATIIRGSYPAPEQGRALAALGDALHATDAADLFAARCPTPCLDALAAQVGAPAEMHTQGSSTRVRTVRGGELVLYRGTDTWYGIEWHTEELMRERSRAAAELDLVQKNAEIYRRAQALAD